MNRVDVLQKIIYRKGRCNYLEIGVRRGGCFFKIRGAKLKIAVDPAFSFSKKVFFFNILKNPSNIFRSSYFSMTSDDFFAKRKNYLKRKKLDLVFIDGLHTYEQSLADVRNTLQYLNPDGIIVMHDCSPESELSATPAKSSLEVRQKLHCQKEWNGNWSGDVWKTIVHLRTYEYLRVFVLDCDFGLGIIGYGKGSRLPFSHGHIQRMQYRDLAASRKELLNLRECVYLETFLETLK